MNFKTIEWKSGKVVILDQRALPLEEHYLECTDFKQVADAIAAMAIRGAPAIGVAGAFAMALGAMGIRARSFHEFIGRMEEIGHLLNQARPTAANLCWAIQRMLSAALGQRDCPLAELAKRLEAEAIAIASEDARMCEAIGRHGAELIRSGMRVMTHCNAGALATAGIGTALAAIYTAKAQGKPMTVFCSETRPWLQGARLTAWELLKNDIPATLIADSAAASLMARREIDLVIVGADRIAANGDTANKIGTLSHAIAARYSKIPFYVAAPSSTIDAELPSGDRIPIEQRGREELTHFGLKKTAPEEVRVLNPVFDVTPADLITGIVTETGVHQPPFHFPSPLQGGGETYGQN